MVPVSVVYRYTATLLFFLVACSAFFSVSADTPVLPSEFYGPLYIHGEPAPAATIVEAKIGGTVYGKIVTTEVGVYGGPGTFDQRLKVIVDSSVLAGNNVIEFWIDGQKAEQSLSYVAGSSTQVILSIGLPPTVLSQPMITQTGTPAPTAIITPTMVPMATVTPIPTSIPEPTYTVPPDMTPTPTPTAYPTLQPTEPYTPFPTATPIQTIVPANPDQIPAFAQTFWGGVMMYDEPIQAGGFVEVRVAGKSISGQNNVVQTGFGFFGRPQSLWPNLEVQGIEEGTSIEFWIWDSVHRESRAFVRIVGEENWQTSLPFQPGRNTEIELAVLSKPPAAIATIPPASIPVSECNGGVPTLPMQIWGTVYFNNIDRAQIAEARQLNVEVYSYLTPIQQGGKVEAIVDGFDATGPTNPLTLRSAVSFGAGTYNEKLAIQNACIPDGAEVRFQVWDVFWQRPASALIQIVNEESLRVAPRAPRTGESWHESIPYRGGEMVQVMLLVGQPPEILTVTPTPTPTPNTAPQHFYGKAEFNGYPLRSGDMILATTEGVDLRNPMNPYIVRSFGTFGNPAGSDVLIVEVPRWADQIISDDSVIVHPLDDVATIFAGANIRTELRRVPITFWIKPQGFQFWYKAQSRNPLSGGEWTDTQPFMPGSIANVDLRTAGDSQFMSFQNIVANLHSVHLPADTTGW